MTDNIERIDEKQNKIQYDYCLNHKQQCIKSWLSGSRNALTYATKVRLVHSIVMSILFNTGSLKKQMEQIISQTLDHNKFLIIYVYFYKLFQCLLKQQFKLDNTKSGLLAGMVLGYLQNREKKPVRQQVVLYLLSRNLLGLINLGMSRNLIPQFDYFPLLGTFCWGFVMYLFQKDSTVLQPSLASSMNFLYKESDQDLTSFQQLIPFTIPTFFIQLFHKIFHK